MKHFFSIHLAANRLAVLDITSQWISSVVMMCQDSTAAVFSSSLFIKHSGTEMCAQVDSGLVTDLAIAEHSSSFASKKSSGLLSKYAWGYCPSVL